MKLFEFFEGKSENRELWDKIKSRGVVPSIDRERYTDLSDEGLEGPFRMKNGQVLYYDPKEGKYYNRDTDMYVDYDEYRAMDEAGNNYHANRTGFARGPRDDERHDLDVAKPSKQVWGLKINGKIWSKDGNAVTFSNKEQALKARQSVLAKRPELEIGLVSKVSEQGVAEGEADGRDKFYYQRNNIWRVMDGDELVHEYKPERYEVVGAKKLLAHFDDEGYDVTHVISPMGVVTYLYGKPDDIDEGDKRPGYVVKASDKPKKVKPSTGGSSAHPYQGKLVGEAEVGSTDYQWTHGKKPGGQGSWFFVAHRGGINFGKDVEGEDYIQLNQMTYGEAKKAAIKWARSKGHTQLFVAT